MFASCLVPPKIESDGELKPRDRSRCNLWSATGAHQVGDGARSWFDCAHCLQWLAGPSSELAFSDHSVESRPPQISNRPFPRSVAGEQVELITAHRPRILVPMHQSPNS